MSYNKWKSTNVYGIFNNKNLTDASGNLIETCNAVFDGNVQCDYLNCITEIDANEILCQTSITCNGFITGDALSGTSITTNSGTIDDLTSATINSFHVYTTDLSCNEIICDGDINGVTLNVTNGNFTGDITCSDVITGNSINSTTNINGATLNVTNGNFSGDVTCSDVITGNSINSTTTINGATLNATNGNFSGDVTCSDTITGNIITSTNDINAVTLNCDVINCSDLIDVLRIDTNELNSNGFSCNGIIGCQYLNLYSSQTTVTSSFSGSIVCSQPFKGPAYKKVIIYCDAIIGSASYTYPTVFVNSPVITSGNNSLVSTLSATSVTVTTTTSTSTFIILEGF
jgi:hypothetical protein